MPNVYAPLCDCFSASFSLYTLLDVPTSRERVLPLFDSLRKDFPAMTVLEHTPSCYRLKEEGATGRWLWVEPRCISGGYIAPPHVKDAVALSRKALDGAVDALALRSIELDSLAVFFTFSIRHRGNHHSVILESFFEHHPFACLADEPGASPVTARPHVRVILGDDPLVQAELWIDAGTTIDEVRAGDYADKSIRVQLAVRRQLGGALRKSASSIAAELFDRTDKLAKNRVLPAVVDRLRTVLETRSRPKRVLAN